MLSLQPILVAARRMHLEHLPSCWAMSTAWQSLNLGHNATSTARSSRIQKYFDAARKPRSIPACPSSARKDIRSVLAAHPSESCGNSINGISQASRHIAHGFASNLILFGFELASNSLDMNLATLHPNKYISDLNQSIFHCISKVNIKLKRHRDLTQLVKCTAVQKTSQHASFSKTILLFSTTSRRRRRIISLWMAFGKLCGLVLAEPSKRCWGRGLIGRTPNRHITRIPKNRSRCTSTRLRG
jgi:hypothetical protein